MKKDKDNNRSKLQVIQSSISWEMLNGVDSNAVCMLALGNYLVFHFSSPSSSSLLLDSVGSSMREASTKGIFPISGSRCSFPFAALYITFGFLVSRTLS